MTAHERFSYNEPTQMQGEALEPVHDFFSRCANEVQVIGGGALDGAAETAHERWRNDKTGLACEGGLSAIAGLAIGATSCTESAVGEKLCSAVALGSAGAIAREFSTGHLNHLSKALRLWQTTWNTSDLNQLAHYRQQAKEDFGPALFSFALDAMLSGVAADVGKHGARTFLTHSIIEERLPISLGGGIRRCSAWSPADPEVVTRYPQYGLTARHHQVSGQTEFSQYVPLYSRPNTFLEKPRQPLHANHGLADYSGRSYYPKIHQVPEYDPRTGFETYDRNFYSPQFIGKNWKLPGERVDLAV